MIDDTRGWISLFIGIITTAFGVLPLLNDFGIVKFNFLSSMPLLIIAGLMIIGAIFLFVDSIHEDNLKTMSIIIGVIILVLGGVPLLARFGIIHDFTSSVLAISIVKNIVLIVSGILLMLGSGD